MKELLTKKELAAWLKVSIRTLDRRRAEGLDLGEVKLGGMVRFDRERIEKALADEKGR